MIKDHLAKLTEFASDDASAGGLAEFGLQGLGAETKIAALPLDSGLRDGPARILDISDLLAFLDANIRLSGIQRVQAAVVEELFAKGASAQGFVVAYHDRDARTIYALSPERVLALIDSVGAANVTSSEVKERLQGVLASRRRITPKVPDSYLVLGAYWIGEEYPTILQRIKNAGTVIGIFVHDVIAITRPQYVTEGTRRAVAEKFSDVMQLADFVVATSEFVAKEVVATLSSELNRSIPVLSVPLSHELTEIHDEAGEAFAKSLPREYVLCVGTLEVRKNHLLLLNAWRALSRKHGGRIPHLVLVGKWGWGIDKFQDQLRDQRNVGGKIIVLGNVSDGELKYLYEHCLFTVFPSFAEGWGLPIGESLAYGKPCIASNATAMPEVGGDFCRYINPHDLIGATAEIERAFIDRAGLKAWTDRVAADFKVRTWAEVVQDLTEKTGKAEELARQSPWRPAVTLEGGQLYWLTRDEIYGLNSESVSERALRFVCAAGWRPIEHWGAWSYRRTAKVEFGTRLPPKTKVRVIMQLRLPPPTTADNVTIHDGDQLSTAITFSGPAPVWARVEAETDERGMVRLRLERQGQVSHLSPDWELYIGISSLAFYAKDDLTQRVRLLEALFRPAGTSFATVRVR